MGGGSSDAASTLKGINKLFNLRLDDKTLINIAGNIGADVAFFILNEPFAIGRGKGDLLEPVRNKARLWHLLVYPGFKVATKDVYEEFDAGLKRLTLPEKDVKIHLLYNDLEKASIAKKRIIGKILEGLAQLLKRRAIVSGSGPSLFCLYGARKEAIRARAKVLRSMPAHKRRGWQIFAVKTF